MYAVLLLLSLTVIYSSLFYYLDIKKRNYRLDNIVLNRGYLHDQHCQEIAVALNDNINIYYC